MNVGNVGQSPAYHQAMKSKTPAQPQQNADKQAEQVSKANTFKDHVAKANGVKEGDKPASPQAAKHHVDVKGGADVKDGANAGAVAKAQEGKEPEETSAVKSFTYGALGMDHPEKVQESDDSSYTAGKFVSALGTIGTILAVIV
ncbi:hypothetical protein [Salinivibrio costicola]|uniref:Uncharacterized protein n=1 Tax=Salinivibrio costicola subsp. alcaliphilus TaxID=272773 RepID=A0ABX3KNQ5_SALCS|nr:hypothetical protein [Salinivibrio costicola]OOF32667.1 hypothetical protein BZJ21_14935 [Salinivibrio costicola subsp. alcaliphilus]